MSVSIVSAEQHHRTQRWPGEGVKGRSCGETVSRGRNGLGGVGVKGEAVPSDVAAPQQQYSGGTTVA